MSPLAELIVNMRQRLAAHDAVHITLSDKRIHVPLHVALLADDVRDRRTEEHNDGVPDLGLGGRKNCASTLRHKQTTPEAESQILLGVRVRGSHAVLVWGELDG